MRRNAILHVSAIMVVLVRCIACVAGQSCSGDFSESCSDVRVEGGSILKAWCGDGQGNFQLASLDLDQHITNNNGRLQCTKTSSGAFSASCLSASVLDASPGVLTADCLDVSSNLLQTQLDLDSYVQNSFGSLTWACL